MRAVLNSFSVPLDLKPLLNKGKTSRRVTALREFREESRLDMAAARRPAMIRPFKPAGTYWLTKTGTKKSGSLLGIAARAPGLCKTQPLNNRPKKQGLKPASAPEGTSDFANGVVYAFLRPVLRSRRHRRRSEVADSSDEQITRLGQNDRAPDISQPAVWSTFSLESPATRRTVRSCLLPRRKRTRHIHIRTRRSRTLAGSTGSSNRSRRN